MGKIIPIIFRIRGTANIYETLTQLYNLFHYFSPGRVKNSKLNYNISKNKIVTN
jgi:hypothetical protein